MIHSIQRAWHRNPSEMQTLAVKEWGPNANPEARAFKADAAHNHVARDKLPA